jgi:hypothetical protein
MRLGIPASCPERPNTRPGLSRPRARLAPASRRAGWPPRPGPAHARWAKPGTNETGDRQNRETKPGTRNRRNRGQAKPRRNREAKPGTKPGKPGTDHGFLGNRGQTTVSWDETADETGQDETGGTKPGDETGDRPRFLGRNRGRNRGQTTVSGRNRAKLGGAKLGTDHGFLQDETGDRPRFLDETGRNCETGDMRNRGQTTVSWGIDPEAVVCPSETGEAKPGRDHGFSRNRARNRGGPKPGRPKPGTDHAFLGN